jgi:hypothetical protein
MFIKYIDIERLDGDENKTILENPEDIIVIEEKVDGGNGCIYLDKDNNLFVCSRNRDLTQEHDEKTFSLQRHLLLKQLKQDKMDRQFYYYIEWMQKHTIFYGDTIPCVIGLDIRPKEGAFGKKPMFLSRQMKEKMFADIGIECVNFKGTYKSKDINDELIKSLLQTSHYYTGQPEGIVLKSYGRLNAFGNQMFAKIVNEEFKEVNRAVFGDTKIKRDNSEVIKFVNMFFTDQRIEKKVHYLIEERNLTLDKSLMKYLARETVKDVFKEELEYIWKMENIDVETMKKLVNHKCLNKLTRMIDKKVRGVEDEIEKS